jgi:hypothetical protein
MDTTGDKIAEPNLFLLEKWFLDFVTDEGEAYIFYAAKMRWHKITVPYKSVLHYSPATGKMHRARFNNVRFPLIKDKTISWKDSALKVDGIWEARADSLNAQLFASVEGRLEWNCFQPTSMVKVKVGDIDLNGLGYAEQLILTVEPWKIPMKELRWGRFVSATDSLLWIEIKSEQTKQWIWFNGEKADNAIVSDTEIIIQSVDIRLKLENRQVIESEKKINQVVKRMLRFIPGFKHSIPFNFLSAEEYKWISRGSLYKNGLPEGEGWVIHEYIDFKNNVSLPVH